MYVHSVRGLGSRRNEARKTRPKRGVGVIMSKLSETFKFGAVVICKQSEDPCDEALQTNEKVGSMYLHTVLKYLRRVQSYLRRVYIELYRVPTLEYVHTVQYIHKHKH